jgi:nucleoside-diphosphate-sugar epimerase
VVQACLRAGFTVGALVLPDEADEYGRRSNSAVTVFGGSLASPPWALLEPWQAEACVHCAWVATPGEYMHSPLNTDFLQWSKAFLRRLCASRPCRLVAVGSCAERLMETQSNPSPYVRCKDELRRFLANEGIGGGCAWARLYYPYGIGEARQRLISAMIEALLAGREFRLQCPDVRKDYVHITDVANALVVLLQAGVQGVVDVGTGSGVRLGDLGGMVAGLIGRADLLRMGDETDPVGDMVADAAPLRAAGWSPAVAMVDGLAGMLRHRLGRA